MLYYGYASENNLPKIHFTERDRSEHCLSCLASATMGLVRVLRQYDPSIGSNGNIYTHPGSRSLTPYNKLIEELNRRPSSDIRLGPIAKACGVSVPYAGLLVRKARNEHPDLGVPVLKPGRPRRTSASALNSTEKSVLELAQAGLTTSGIAILDGKSTATVRKT